MRSTYGKYACLLFVVFLLCAKCFAQDAKSNFAQAGLAYEAGKYKEALYYAGETERALGKSNPKIQSLKTMCYYEQGDNESALLELIKYFRTIGTGMDNTEGYKEMQALQKELLEANKRAYDLKKIASENEMKEELGKISDNMNGETEEMEYRLVKESGSVKAMQAFVKKYPSSSHNTEFNKNITEVNKGLDYDNLVIKGDHAMKAGKWQTARSNYSKANEIRKEKSITAKIDECNELEYKERMAEGDLNTINRDWESAIKSFTEALAIKDRSEAEVRLENARDNNAFFKALKNDEISDYVQYLKNFDDPLFKKTAEDLIIGKVLDRAESEYKAGESYAVEESLKQAFEYQSSRIWQHYQARYYEIMRIQAEKLTKGTKDQRITAVPQAISLYEKLNEEFSPKYSSTIDKLKRKQTRWDRPDYGFGGWHADQENLLGIMMGQLNNRKLGWYIAARTGDAIFEGSEEAYWETDNNNSVTGSVDPRKTFTGAVTNKTVYGTIGLTKKIVHPLWFYVGAGICVNTELRQFEHTQTKELENVVNKDAKYTAPNGDAGLYLLLGPVVLSYGVNRPFSDKFTGTIIHHFGVAFSL